jgi:hypothetical protein
MRKIDESRAFLQECFFLAQQKFGVDFYSLDEDKQNEIADEASGRILL